MKRQRRNVLWFGLVALSLIALLSGVFGQMQRAHADSPLFYGEKCWISFTMLGAQAATFGCWQIGLIRIITSIRTCHRPIRCAMLR